MYRETWNNCHGSICSISFYNQSGQKVGSGTGFKVKSFLITNNHVIIAPGAVSVELKFVSEDGHNTRATKVISYLEFQARLIMGMPENSWDYAILKLDDKEFSAIPSLTLADSKTVSIGQKIAVMGFQFDQINLSIKQGILSSRYTKANVKYMQIDASVNHGNSGGPLINVDNNRVVGIVTRKHTGLTQAFDELIKSYDGNIAAFEKVKGGLSMSGIDPFEVFIIGQNQMKATSKEIQRSANVGIGFAYELEQVKDFLDHQ